MTPDQFDAYLGSILLSELDDRIERLTLSCVGQPKDIVKALTRQVKKLESQSKRIKLKRLARDSET